MNRESGSGAKLLQKIIIIAIVILTVAYVVHRVVTPDDHRGTAVQKAHKGETGRVILDLSFDDGDTSAADLTYEDGGSASLSADDGRLSVTVSSVGENPYSVLLLFSGFMLEDGCDYELSFDLMSDADRKTELQVMESVSPYSVYYSYTVSADESLKDTDVWWSMDEAQELPAVALRLGKCGDMAADFPEHHIYIDNVRLTEYETDGGADGETDGGSGRNSGSKQEEAAAANQVGYDPDDPKTVYVTGSEGESFAVTDVSSGETVYTGSLGSEVFSVYGQTGIRTGDFSDFRESGEYTVRILDENGDAAAESQPFSIGAGLYGDILPDVIRMLYMQRCGTALTEELAGEFEHDPCHTAEARIYGTDDYTDVSGGWHDAGDYGRYTVTGAVTVANLMLLYEYGYDSDDLNIPESGNGIPDVLDEARWELSWLLKMQDAESGGVRHKVSTAWPAEHVMADMDDVDELYAAPISAAATGDFAAVMAKASALYRQYDGEFASQTLEAAKKAWSYLEDESHLTGYEEPSGLHTGQYADAFVEDEVYWAASQLFLHSNTGSEKWESYLKSHALDTTRCGLGWSFVYSYAMYDLAGCDDETLSSMALETLENIAGRIEGIAENDALGLGLEESEYGYGSNGAVSTQAQLLLMVYELTGESHYKEAALKMRDYLFGSNLVGYSFITGAGAGAASHPYYRPSMVIGHAFDGMLVLGVNKDLDDGYARAALSGRAPLYCYIDSQNSYSTNEVTINANSSLACVLLLADR